MGHGNRRIGRPRSHEPQRAFFNVVFDVQFDRASDLAAKSVFFHVLIGSDARGARFERGENFFGVVAD